MQALSQPPTARVLAPANPQQRPAASVPANQPLPAAPQFPTVTVVADGRDAAWRHAPVARLMPDRWIAVLRAGAATISATGRSIVQPLPVGPDPALPAPNPAADQLAVDAGMKWMIDFDEAEAKGMALRLTVPPDALSAGLGRCGKPAREGGGGEGHDAGAENSAAVEARIAVGGVTTRVHGRAPERLSSAS